MQLTRATDYALRTLMYLGAAPKGRATIAEIAAGFAISQAHLMKVVHQLGQLGYLSTLRGRGGGIQLARPPDEILVGTVVRDVEKNLAVLECLERADACPITRCCVLRGALRAATAAFLNTLDEYSLADLLRPRVKLTTALGLTPRTGDRPDTIG